MLLRRPSDWQNPSETICLECAACHNPVKIQFANNQIKIYRSSHKLLPSTLGLQCVQRALCMHCGPIMAKLLFSDCVATAVWRYICTIIRLVNFLEVHADCCY